MEKLFGMDDPKVAKYAEEVFQPEDEILKEIRLRSEKNDLPMIQVGSMDALHLEVLTKMSGAKLAVEIGTLGGYSGVAICRGLHPEGKLFTFENNPKHAEVAAESFGKAGFADRVEIHVGPALLNLPTISKQGPFDLVFIDADKGNYSNYLKWAAENLRIGGVVIADNTFAWGTIADEKFPDSNAEQPVVALRSFNLLAARGGRFKSTILPTGEGLTIAIKIK
jgi:caffeoyl-CoA O-methyltransferase